MLVVIRLPFNGKFMQKRKNEGKSHRRQKWAVHVIADINTCVVA